FLTEGIVLAALGGSLGLLLAVWVSQALPRVLLESGSPISFDLYPNIRILGFLAAVSLLTGILCSLAGAFQGTRANPALALKSVHGALARASRLSPGRSLLAPPVP